ncbi:uncharacterized protein [Physcomitrium patens]|uniref:uncharacterized protein n=1 Tax=Physcomitrium patens TaxID=3218 RepID=UPI003CCD8B63
MTSMICTTSNPESLCQLTPVELEQITGCIQSTRSNTPSTIEDTRSKQQKNLKLHTYRNKEASISDVVPLNLGLQKQTWKGACVERWPSSVAHFPTCLPAPSFPNVPSFTSQKSDQRLRLYLSGFCDPTAHNGERFLQHVVTRAPAPVPGRASAAPTLWLCPSPSIESPACERRFFCRVLRLGPNSLLHRGLSLPLRDLLNPLFHPPQLGLIACLRSCWGAASLRRNV